MAGLGLGNAVWGAKSKAVLSRWRYPQPGLLHGCNPCRDCTQNLSPEGGLTGFSAALLALQ